MTPDTWQQVSPWLDALLDKPAGERAHALADLARTAPALAREVAALLQEADTHENLHHAPSQWFAAIDVSERPPTFTPTHADRYTIEREIARGGMGIIYRVTDAAFGRSLAIKTLLPSAWGVRSWFEREARITGRLQHPGIPPVHEVGTLADGTPFFAMKLIAGRTLAEVLHDADWSKRVLDVFEQVCRTLAYAHQQGIMHRDLKPQNIMVGAFGEVQVMDWGLATPLPTAVGWELPPLAPEGVVGTPAYMAPEQACGAALDERCDVFGLGALLCAMLTKQPPYLGTGPAELLEAATNADVEPAIQRMAAAGADAELLTLARRCLHPERDQRFPNAGAVAEAVAAYRVGMRERLRQAEMAVVRAAEERRRRRVWFLLVGSLLLLAAGVLGVWGWTERLHAQRVERAAVLNGQIKQALDEAANTRQGIYDTLTNPATARDWLNDLRPWQAHLQRLRTTLAEARRLVTSDHQNVAPELATRLDQLERDSDTDEADWLLAKKADTLRLEHFDQRRLALPGVLEAAYQEAFQGHGWDILYGGSAVIDELQHSSLKYIVVSVLDDWAFMVLARRPRDESTLARLLLVARTLDPDPQRDAWRQPSTWTDSKQVQTCSDPLPIATQAPALLRSVAMVRKYHRLPTTRLLNAALQVYPNDFWLLYLQGFHALDSDIITALAACRAALALRPDDTTVLINLGNACGLRGDHATASECFQKVIRLRPDDAIGHLDLGKTYFDQGRYPEAVAAIQRALQLEPDEPTALNNLTAVWCALGDFGAALEPLERLAARKPKDKNTQANLQAIRAMRQQQQRLATVENETLALATLAKGHRATLTPQHPTEWFTGLEEQRRAGYSVELQAGTAYQFDVQADFDTMLRIDDHRWHSLLYNDDRRRDDPAPRLVFTPPTTGRYQVAVVASKPGLTGPFTLVARPTTRVSTETRHGTLSRQTPILAGRYQQRWPIKGVAHQPLVVTLHSAAFPTALRLFDATGRTELAKSDALNPFDKTFARIDYTPATTGTYYAVVGSTIPDLLGPYTLTMEQYQALSKP